MKNFQDSTETSTMKGRIDKDSDKIEAQGTADELNSFIGLAMEEVDEEIKNYLSEIQKTVFVLGFDITSGSKNIENHDVKRLEDILIKTEEELDSLENFVIPSGSKAYSLLHICRTICRRLERRLVPLRKNNNLNEECFKYVNRLSDVFFNLARLSHKKKDLKETLWKM